MVSTSPIALAGDRRGGTQGMPTGQVGNGPAVLATSPEDRIRDDLSNLLWPALLLALRGTGAARGFVRWQAAVQHDLDGAVEPKTLAESLDGRLTGLDRLVELQPGADAIIKQRAAEPDLLPPPVTGSARDLPERPAGCLVEGDLRSPGQGEVDLVAKAVLETIRDGHREAVIKCLQFGAPCRPVHSAATRR